VEHIDRTEEAIDKGESFYQRLDELENPSHPIGRKHGDGDAEPAFDDAPARSLDPAVEARCGI
jgi:hypothetical protein